MKAAALLFASVLLLAGCSSLETHEAPKVDLNTITRYFVEHNLTDDHHIDDLIVAELKSRGKDVSSGPLTMMPDNTEVVVSYDEAWAWDFKSYLIALQVDIRKAHSDQPIGQGKYAQPSPITKNPAAVVHIIFTKLFKSPIATAH